MKLTNVRRRNSESENTYCRIRALRKHVDGSWIKFTPSFFCARNSAPAAVESVLETRKNPAANGCVPPS